MNYNIANPGPIPSSISKLTKLREMYLYGNRLSGTIPDLSPLQELQVLYLNENQLTGASVLDCFRLS